MPGLADGDFDGAIIAVLATSGCPGPCSPLDEGFAATSPAGRGRGSGGPNAVWLDGCCGGSPDASAFAGKVSIRGGGVSVGTAPAEASPSAAGVIPGGREVSGPYGRGSLSGP